MLHQLKRKRRLPHQRRKRNLLQNQHVKLLVVLPKPKSTTTMKTTKHQKRKRKSFLRRRLQLRSPLLKNRRLKLLPLLRSQRAELHATPRRLKMKSNSISLPSIFFHIHNNIYSLYSPLTLHVWLAWLLGQNLGYENKGEKWAYFGASNNLVKPEEELLCALMCRSGVSKWNASCCCCTLTPALSKPPSHFLVDMDLPSLRISAFLFRALYSSHHSDDA